MSKSALLRQEVQTIQDPVAQDGLTLRESLRQATRKEHEALESGLDLMRAGFGMPEYRELLVKFHGFYVSFESFLQEQAKQGSAPAVFYRKARCKADWLAADLKSLGIFHRAGETALTPAGLRLLFPRASHQLGAIYVLEGSMLGGRVLSRHFGTSLGLTAEHGLQFFSGYGASMAGMWNGMLHLLESEAADAVPVEEVITGARSMFVLLGRHLGVTAAR